jgi:hypothetical protein
MVRHLTLNTGEFPNVSATAFQPPLIEFKIPTKHTFFDRGVEFEPLRPDWQFSRYIWRNLAAQPALGEDRWGYQ